MCSYAIKWLPNKGFKWETISIWYLRFTGSRISFALEMCVRTGCCTASHFYLEDLLGPVSLDDGLCEQLLCGGWRCPCIGLPCCWLDPTYGFYCNDRWAVSADRTLILEKKVANFFCLDVFYVLLQGIYLIFAVSGWREILTSVNQLWQRYLIFWQLEVKLCILFIYGA